MSLNVNLNGNMSGFSQMLNAAKTQTKAFANAVTHEVGSSWGGIGKSFAAGIAGMFTIEGIKGFAESVLNTGKEIKQLSEQMNMGADDVQKWGKAVDRAGLSLGGLQNIVAKFQELKETAKLGSAEGVKARETLNNLGVSNDDILTDSGFSGEQIAKILGNADAGAGQRSRLSEVIGTRGLKYGAAAKFYAGAEPDWDSKDREMMEQAEQAERKWNRLKTKMGVGVFKVATDKEFRSDWARRSAQFLTGGLLGNPFEDDTGPGVQKMGALPYDKNKTRQENIAANAKRRQDEADAKRDSDESKRRSDAAMQGYIKGQDLDFASQKQAAEFAIHRAMGGTMTIGDRRNMIRGDLDKMNSEVAARAAAVKSGKLYGLTDEEDAEDKSRSESEHKKKLRQQELELLQKQAQAASMKAELKEKPLSWSGTSMAKVGLYSGSQVAFNPLLSVGHKTNQLLEKVVQNTSPHATADKLKNPYHP